MIPKVDDLIKSIDSAEKQTNGPERYVVGSMKWLVYSNARLEDAINHFEKTTSKTEKWMTALAIIQTMSTFVALLLTLSNRA